MKTPLYFFDYDGLRFGDGFLRFMRSKMKDLTTQEQSEFVDAITYKKVCDGDLCIPIEDTVKVHQFNTTAVGNLAFIALYHPDKLQVIRAKNLLERYL